MHKISCIIVRLVDHPKQGVIDEYRITKVAGII